MLLRRLPWLLLPMIVLLLVLSALPPLDRPSASSSAPSAEPSPPAVECSWEQQASAWVDVNANGQRDGDEQPLAGVEFVVKGLDSSLEYGLAGTTDADGQAMLSVLWAGCPDNRLEVTARPPAGYRATTAAQVESLRMIEQAIAFGFVAAP